MVRRLLCDLAGVSAVVGLRTMEMFRDHRQLLEADAISPA